MPRKEDKIYRGRRNPTNSEITQMRSRELKEASKPATPRERAKAAKKPRVSPSVKITPRDSKYPMTILPGGGGKGSVTITQKPTPKPKPKPRPKSGSSGGGRSGGR